MAASPEIGLSIKAGGIETNYHEQGEGQPLVLFHGSGPGVSAFANWRLVIPALSESFRVIAPDMVGFGYTEKPEGQQYNMEAWLAHALGIFDALNIEKAHVIGNSFGGALSLALAIHAPERVDRLVLMGSVGLDFELTEGLDKTWGYTPSFENMKQLLDIFAYDRSLVTDELAELRYQASMREGVQEAYASMFPAPRQDGIHGMASSEDDIARIEHETLIIHGLEDEVIPVSCSERLLRLIQNSQLHVFRKCGHWTQIEHNARFIQLTENFLKEDDA